MYQIEISHDGLHKYRIIKGTDKYVVEQKAQVQLAKWDEMWQKKQEELRKKEAREQEAREKEQKKQLAKQKTQEAEALIENLSHVLRHTLDINDIIEWDSLLDSTKFSEPQPDDPIYPTEPYQNHSQYDPQLTLFDKLIKSRKEEKIQAAINRFDRDHAKWEEECAIIKEKYEEELNEWKAEKKAFYDEQAEKNKHVEEQKQSYFSSEPAAIVDYCDMVLSNSEYPDFFPQDYELDYNPENKILIVDYILPDIDDMPTLTAVKYIQSRNEFSEKHLSQTALNKLYDNLIYEVALRTIHELYEADVVNGITSIVFNGFVHSVDKATGQDISPCILSLQANRDEFLEINLAKVEPKACFKNLKGVASAKLHSLSPVAPIIQIDKDDKRFVSSYGVSEGLDDTYNLAAMDWEDFEHLIRELFEQEFVQSGGEVNVTQASRDGGVDAIAFDPDPIRGGKIVIQAKRYTNTVGVAAVRDLYGTLVNEGATKGILVTTSDYGPDAYRFAKGKPISLLNGGNLLHLLERHGHKAKIDIFEAKRLQQDK
ncbi:MAG: restriction endonuclease [Chitinivibrionales bacterium]|nr:restriction endonuclease [Chitinivibrionales bacterium]